MIMRSSGSGEKKKFDVGGSGFQQRKRRILEDLALWILLWFAAAGASPPPEHYHTVIVITDQPQVTPPPGHLRLELPSAIPFCRRDLRTHGLGVSLIPPLMKVWRSGKVLSKLK
ncbi:unnamed protein product [Cuscuta epithymum]|uniref:Uncharacterized protein n=1 Tax=Cuscuta epithymum TaxID=186058 RepID=A0AAV0FD27_9ASTE|nr:unnamed protein product [Cuscuta epithymum]